MKNSETFNIKAHGDREIVVTRVFDAPRQLVFDAYTRPELIQKWLLGPDGWSMPVCEIDLGREANTATSGKTTAVETKWGWVASIARWWRRSGLLPLKYSTRRGIPERRWTRSCERARRQNYADADNSV